MKTRKASKEKDLNNIVEGKESKASSDEADSTHKIVLKTLAGRWSSSIEISHNMAADGVIRIPASRWPQLNAKNPSKPNRITVSCADWTVSICI
jgi:hypothetical protein